MVTTLKREIFWHVDQAFEQCDQGFWSHWVGQYSEIFNVKNMPNSKQMTK